MRRLNRPIGDDFSDRLYRRLEEHIVEWLTFTLEDHLFDQIYSALETPHNHLLSDDMEGTCEM